MIWRVRKEDRKLLLIWLLLDAVVLSLFSCRTDWDKFRTQHHCVYIGERETPIIKRTQRAFKCDDGITYWR